MSQIRPEDTPQRVNKLLMDKWHISLFKFAQVFAISPSELFLRRNTYPFTGDQIKEIKHTIKKMQADLLKGARHIRRITERLWEVPEEKVSDDELVKEMHLTAFTKRYIHKYEVVIRYLEKTSLQVGRGVGINKKSIIAVGWGNLVSEGNRRIDWKLLGDLYEWFWNRVCSHRYYNELKPVFGLEEHLRHQYNVHRWVGGAGEYICQKLKMSEDEILTFAANLYLQRFVGGQEDYFRDKFPMTEEKFNKLFLNFFVDTYLAGTDGLTLFTENQSLADPLFLFMYMWLGKSAGKYGLPPMAPESFPMGINFSGADDPYAETQISDYMVIAAKHFLEHKADFSELPPLILFPDKSRF
jgi:hypothetical protein